MLFVWRTMEDVKRPISKFRLVIHTCFTLRLNDVILSCFIFPCTWGTHKRCVLQLCVWFLPPTTPFTSTPTLTLGACKCVLVCVWKPDPFETDTSTSFIYKTLQLLGCAWVCTCAISVFTCIVYNGEWFPVVSLMKKVLNCTKYALVVYFKINQN